MQYSNVFGNNGYGIGQGLIPPPGRQGASSQDAQRVWSRSSGTLTPGEVSGDDRSPETVRHPALDEASAKQAIKAYFEQHHGEVMYPDDVADALGLDILQAVQLCAALAEEGEIGEANQEGDPSDSTGDA